jgi:C1A family cysteine protease
VSLDWRDKNLITSVKNQGACGCCWAFATVAYAESRLIGMNAKYTIQNTDLSEQYMLECTKNSDCTGGYLEYAFQTGQEIPT